MMKIKNCFYVDEEEGQGLAGGITGTLASVTSSL